LEPVSGVLFSLYRGTPQHEEWIIACLQGAWKGIVGERLAEMCRPSAMKGTELIVEITDASWMKTLKGVKRNIAEKLRTATSGEVKSISLIQSRKPDQ
jgi:predicted nucleic acid-binding Zn ribbon protein